jgi:hypothetical protein
MKTVVVALYRPTRDGRKPPAAGGNAERLAMRLAQGPDAADPRIGFLTSLWCGAMVGCVGASVIPPFRKADHEGIRANGRMRPE